MIPLLLLLVFPLVWPFVAKIIWKHKLTGVEHAINIGVGVLVVLAGYGFGLYREMGDVQILNGKVVAKEIVRVSCTHSYSCRCRQVCSGSGKNRSCHRECDTCYEHNNDWDHDLRTTLGTITIDRVDRQGKVVPPRYTSAQINDPVAQTNYYRNYIKAAPDSIFNKAQNALLLEQYQGKLPPYPNHVYDYHRLDRVISVGLPVTDMREWNVKLATALNDLGKAKQVNAVIVLTNETNPNYANALSAYWLGGKKNDVIAVLGSPTLKPSWVRIISWTDNEVFKVELRDALMALEEFTADSVISTMSQHISKSFARKPMEDFSYLKDTIEPPVWLLITLFLLSAAASIGCTIICVRNDIDSN